MIAVCNSVVFQLQHFEADPTVRFLIFKASFNNCLLVIVNLYAPNSYQNRFYKNIIGKIQHFQKDCIIICGDFHSTIDYTLLTPSGNSPQCTQPFFTQKNFMFYGAACMVQKELYILLTYKKSYSMIYLLLTNKFTITLALSHGLTMLLAPLHFSQALSPNLLPYGKGIHPSLVSHATRSRSKLRLRLHFFTDSVSNVTTLWNVIHEGVFVLRSVLMRQRYTTRQLPASLIISTHWNIAIMYPLTTVIRWNYESDKLSS